ncbi:MAG: hypothetical protein IPL23_28290 [Saprospiraceae bacterium]|nr:hypothetical protein [Saprospiraceae bacterium]
MERQNWLALSESLKLPSPGFGGGRSWELHNMYPEEDLRYEVLCQLLRMYDGIFIESIEINETQLSRTLNIPDRQNHPHSQNVGKGGDDTL